MFYFPSPPHQPPVRYGDTDSLFVECPGKTRAQAFQIGAEIVREVNQRNPAPIQLKLEKVYQPCFLVTKKRYVGNMYESPGTAKATQLDCTGRESQFTMLLLWAMDKQNKPDPFSTPRVSRQFEGIHAQPSRES